MAGNVLSQALRIGINNGYINLTVSVQQPSAGKKTNCQVKFTGNYTTLDSNKTVSITTSCASSYTGESYYDGPTVILLTGGTGSINSGWYTVNGLSCGTGLTTFNIIFTFTGTTQKYYDMTLQGTVYWQYLLTLTNDGHGTTAKNQNYLSGNQYNISATPNAGYTFNKWETVSGNAAYLNSGQTKQNCITELYANTTIKANFKEIPKISLKTNTNPKINSSSSVTVKYGTTFTISWTKISNAASYTIWTYGETAGTYGHDWTKSTNGGTATSKSGMGNYSADAIGYYYRYYVQPVASSSGSYSTPTASSCDYVRVLVAGAIYLYDINGKILSDWNNRLATSWNSSQVSYSISGYNAVKWYTKPNGQGTEISNYSTAQFRSTGNLILYAYATKKQATVTFDAQGGTCSPATKTVNVGTDLNLSTATTITSVPVGKSFKGWSKSVNGSIINGTINITSDTKLYAVWIDNYNISYNLNPATLITGTTLTTSPTTIVGGEKKNGVDFPIYGTTPTMQGHTFLHWKDSSGTTYPVGGVYTANTGTTLTAIWSSNTYNLTFATPLNGAPGPTITSVTATFNQNYVLPSVPPHDEELWAPKNPFWLVQNGASSASYPAGGNLPMIYANNNTVITPQWTQITYWRGGWLWIYVPEEGGFN